MKSCSNGFGAASLDAAFVDADFAAWYLHGHPQLGDLRLVTEYVPRERWNMALAVRARDAQLLVELNRALAQLAESGELRQIYAEHGVPFRPPFTASAPRPATSDTWRRIRDRGELVVSMDPANLPYSSAKEDRPGFDVELARALAEQLQRQAAHRLARRPATRPRWGSSSQHQCDLVFGEAVAANTVADDEELAGKVLYSRPYYGTGYVLVRRKDGPRVQSLAELKGAKSQRLGTEAGSVADYSLRQRGYLRRLYRNQLATLKALSDGDIDSAYLWANVGWTLHASPEFKLEIVPDYVPEDHWNIAIAMGAGERRAEAARRRGSGRLDRGRDGRPRPGPLPRASLRPLRGTSRRCPGKRRATDPSRSRQPRARAPDAEDRRPPSTRTPDWPGSARPASWSWGWIRTTCRFRRPTPGRQGSTYEIAGLLAEQLGVTLAGLLGLLRARFLSLEAGGQAALRRDPGGHARRSVRPAGALFPALLCREVPTGRREPAKDLPRRTSRWPWRRVLRCAG